MLGAAVGSVLPQLQWQSDSSICQKFPAGHSIRSWAHHPAIWQGVAHTIPQSHMLPPGAAVGFVSFCCVVHKPLRATVNIAALIVPNSLDLCLSSVYVASSDWEATSLVGNAASICNRNSAGLLMISVSWCLAMYENLVTDLSHCRWVRTNLRWTTDILWMLSRLLVYACLHLTTSWVVNNSVVIQPLSKHASSRCQCS